MQRIITLYNAQVVHKVLQEYLRHHADAEYTVGARWKAEAARQVGLDRTTVAHIIERFEDWLGHPLFERVPIGLGHPYQDNLYVLTDWGAIVNDTLSRILGDAHYEGLIPLMRRKINVFEGRFEVVPPTKGIVRMQDFILTWQVGQGTGFPALSHYLSRQVNRRILVVEAFLGVKLIRRPTSSKRHNWTEIGLFLERELREIAEAWMELSANRGGGG